ncbi:MAG: HEPN domain-containing protein [Candidatus Freyarchaeota archaeon]|nr:HEPN domain-containing protein [Candidatus Jordarchaeia archaeon]MBS7268924.1 HEPN domain-containing protein [Candidatus Jordarchaeia archaeon]
MNSEEEAKYRLTLAQGYLERAEEASKRGDHLAVISNSQLSVENSAKAVISCFRIPSWSHDPSSELLEVTENNRDKIEKRTGVNVYHALSTLASYSSNLAPEHGRMSYGDPNLRIPPWNLANAQRAKEALSYARESVEIAKKFIERWFSVEPK